jgi:hypothetical protein
MADRRDVVVDAHIVDAERERRSAGAAGREQLNDVRTRAQPAGARRLDLAPNVEFEYWRLDDDAAFTGLSMEPAANDEHQAEDDGR